MRLLISSFVLFACTFVTACGDAAPSGPELGDADLTVLFIGNSLTYTHDVPGLFATIAEATGHTVAYGEITAGNFSLEDHWNNGIEGAIRSAGADVVIMQQGPSSLPENQIHLRTWAERLAEPIREAGGRPALYMVWPSRARLDFMQAVRASYSNAATAVNGDFLPAGMAWVRAWDIDPGFPLYGPDDFHPSELGATAAALTIYSVLFEAEVGRLPNRLVPNTPGLRTIELSAETAAILYAAVDAAVDLPAPAN